ncbi:MAG TPA: formate dehydrogenase, partial [Candidatus Korarchaeota archaeon]|nr:formate dehydrogenase [Candidatus Korarchaeota archaeon]
MSEGEAYVTCQRDCPDACGMLVGIRDGRVVSVRGDPHHPVTRGFLCPKSRGYVAYDKSPKRILYPYIRTGPKGSGHFKKIDWEEALDIISDKIKEILSKYGPDQIVHFEYLENTGLISFYYPQRLFNALNATGIEYTICDLAGEVAISLHYGERYGAFPSDLERSRLIVVWGANPASSSVHAYSLMAKAKSKGAEIVVIDPRKTRTAYLGWHITPRPGTDGFLALSIAHTLIEEDLVDWDFIKDKTSGFESYKELVSRFPPEVVEEISGVEANVIRRFAKLYAERKPNVIYIGIGLQKSRCGAEAVRAICLLPALVGVDRGFFFCNSVRDFDLRYLAGEHLRTAPTRKVNMIRVGRLLAEGEFRFIYIYGSNPAVTVPRADLFRKGLMREDLFVVVHQVVWNETAELADIVLPATNMYEQFDVVVSYWHPYVQISEGLATPLGESKPGWFIVQQLAKKLNLERDELYEDPKETLDLVLRKSKMLNGGLEDLKMKKILKLKYPPKDVYQTPSGKIEFVSSLAMRFGLSPLPNLRLEEPPDEFPIILLSSSIPRLASTQY